MILPCLRSDGGRVRAGHVGWGELWSKGRSVLRRKAERKSAMWKGRGPKCEKYLGRKSPPLNPLTLPYSLFCKQGDSETFHIPKPRRPLVPRQGGCSGPLNGCCSHFIQSRMLQIPCRVPDSQRSQGPQPAEQSCPCLPFSGQ